ncbi:hypothetical protein AUC69_09150 [Methyloceanibacter superfactus]|jgi:hypothetical protein|uniref:Uncharacterized protein n=1 Tax=Methyloceanibacter superfactus TaxID=1774969 RepID=A0A1E3W1R4_9HYPH|nr:hypothetical protein [Methyloceanibacter superfactus]ODR99757.1 hypothetical protein AUC69_09150 [Methyloceanibacter superfactus]
MARLIARTANSVTGHITPPFNQEYSKVLEGDMPAKGEDVAVFIDIIGMPLTPLSYAGVARRSFRRAAIY